MKKQFPAVLILLFFNAVAFCQDGPINTDRPSQTPAAGLLKPGILQFESGVLRRSGESFNSVSLNSLWRFGINENFELRAFIDYVSLNRELDGADGNEDGWAPLQLGTKVKILDARGWIPQASLVAMVALPSGEGSFQTSRATPDLRLAFANDLPGILDVFYSVGIFWTPDDFNTVELYTLGLGITLSDKFWSFVEVYGYSGDVIPSPSLNGGFTWLISDQVKLDLTGGFDFPSDGGGFISSGVSFRIGR